MMDAHQAKMRLVQSVSSSLIPGKVFIHLQYVQIHFKVTFFCYTWHIEYRPHNKVQLRAMNVVGGAIDVL